MITDVHKRSIALERSEGAHTPLRPSLLKFPMQTKPSPTTKRWSNSRTSPVGKPKVEITVSAPTPLPCALSANGKPFSRWRKNPHSTNGADGRPDRRVNERNRLLPTVQVIACLSCGVVVTNKMFREWQEARQQWMPQSSPSCGTQAAEH